MLHSPFFGSGKLEYYLAARRPALEVRGVDAFEPVANLRRFYLRQDPVFLRSLLRLVGRKVNRRFYFSRLLAGSQRGRAGRRAACSYVLLRNSFLGKWGSFTQQRPLTLSSAQRLQRPPRNVTVRCQDALAYALPCLAPRHCIYAHPPYIFPGRSMNYYGARGRGHDMAFHFSSQAACPSSLLGQVTNGDSSAGWSSPVFRAESGIQSKVTVWSLLSTENGRIWRLRRPTCSPTRKNELFGLDRFERFLHQKRSRTTSLTDHLGGLTDGAEKDP